MPALYRYHNITKKHQISNLLNLSLLDIQTLCLLSRAFNVRSFIRVKNLRLTFPKLIGYTCSEFERTASDR